MSEEHKQPHFPVNLSENEQKELFKNALKEWLDEKVAEFGWWSLKSLGMVVIAAVVAFAVHNGLLFK